MCCAAHEQGLIGNRGTWYHQESLSKRQHGQMNGCTYKEGSLQIWLVGADSILMCCPHFYLQVQERLLERCFFWEKMSDFWWLSWWMWQRKVFWGVLCFGILVLFSMPACVFFMSQLCACCHPLICLLFKLKMSFENKSYPIGAPWNIPKPQQTDISMLIVEDVCILKTAWSKEPPIGTAQL